MNTPSVDILIATHNGEEFLRELLMSISRQTYVNWNVIVSDDVSSDNTMMIIDDFAIRHPSQVDIIQRSTSSGSAAANFLSILQYSKSDYVMFCDQDDVWSDQKIQVLVSAISEFENNKPALVFCDMVVTDSKLKQISSSFMRYSNLDPTRTATQNLLGLAVVPGCASCFNSKLREIACRTTNYSSIIMHDTWISLLASIYGEIRYVNQSLLYYRQHDSNSIGAKSYLEVILSGLNRNKRRLLLTKTLRQAEKLINEYGDDMPSEKRNLIESYASLDSFSRLERIKVMNRMHFWKFGLARKIDQLFNL